MGNKNSKARPKDSVDGDSCRRYNVYLCRSDSLFSKEYNEWLEFEDPKSGRKVMSMMKQVGDNPSPYGSNIRIFAGCVRETDIPAQLDPTMNAFDVLKEMKLRTKYEVYVCRKIESENYHIWVEIVATARPFNDIVHKFHMQIRQEDAKQIFSPSSPSQLCLQKVRMNNSPGIVFFDHHKRLFPPGEYNAVKVSVGFSDLSISDICYLSQAIGEKLSSRKKPDLMSVNCRTYVLRLLECLDLPMRHKALEMLNANWGTGLGMEEVWKGIGMGTKLGVLIGSGITLATLGICWTAVVATVGFLNPAKVGELVGIGMIVTGGVLIVGGVASLTVGGMTGGLVGSVCGGIKANMKDKGFENVEGENVIRIGPPDFEGDF